MEDAKKFMGRRVRARKRYPARQWIKNQNPYGSCATHGAVNAVERNYFDRTGVRKICQPHVVYGLVNGGSDNGALLVDVAKVIGEYGIPLLEDAPDSSKIFKRQYTEAQRQSFRRIKGEEIYECENEAQLVSGLAMGMHAVVAVDVDNAFANYKGGGVAPSGRGPGNHCVSVDDCWYDTASGQWVYDSPGSWGLEMGDSDARWLLTWKTHFALTSRYHMFYLIPSTGDVTVV